MLLRVANVLLAKPFESVDELQRSLVSYKLATPYDSQHSQSATGESEPCDTEETLSDGGPVQDSSHSLVRVIDIHLQSAAMITAALDGAPTFREASLTTRVAKAKVAQHFFLIGDAAFLAHYRLGVGCNAMFTTAKLLSRLLASVRTQKRALPLEVASTSAKSSTQDDGFQLEAANLVRSFVNFQLSTMFFESYCDLVVFFNSNPDHGPTEVLKSQVGEMLACVSGSFSSVVGPDLSFD